MTPGDTTALKDESRSVSKREFRCQQGRIYGCSSLALFPPVSEFFWNACQFLHIEDALCTYLPKKTLGEIHINIAATNSNIYVNLAQCLLREVRTERLLLV